MATKKPAVEVDAAVPGAEPLPSAAEARTELGRALRVYQAFAAADRVLAVLENAEQVIAERTKAAVEASAAAAAAIAERDAALADVAAAKQEAKDTRADAKQRAANMLDEARAAAQQVTQEAQQKLATLTADASAKAAELADLGKQIAALHGELAEAQRTIEKARAARSALAGV